MRDVVIAGAGMTRFAKAPTRTVGSLADEAVRTALDDAGLQAQDVGMVFYGNAASGLMTGQEMIRGQAALRDTGLLGIPIVNVENACASSSSAAHLAWLAVASGQVDVALAVGAEKLTHPDKHRALDAIATAIDLERRDEIERSLRAEGAAGSEGSRDSRGSGGTPPGAGGTGSSRSLFMEIYASKARAYMATTGATADDLAQVVVKSHDHAARNPRAQYRQRVTVDDVLGSRTISSPLTLLMCSPIGDGAAAVVLCSGDMGRRLSADPVRILTSVLVSGREGTDADDVAASAEARAAALAFERAGIGPQDLDVVELHDAAAPAELVLYEALGLCSAGDGPGLLRSGATTLGGTLPVNPSGGLLSKGHPIGATGCAQLVELVDQLRGRAGDRQVAGARLGLTENGGGSLGSDVAAATVHILAT